jgi:hypothetical protein
LEIGGSFFDVEILDDNHFTFSNGGSLNFTVTRL